MATKTVKPKKHVILLGAGASITSGYPDANGLAVLMCDREAFAHEFIARVSADGETQGKSWITGKSTVRTYYDSFRKSVELLRSGDFATMDELSNLAQGGKHAGEVTKLKKLMRFIFALNDPDVRHWAKSDYRAFIQGLFERKSELRNDISIISFNYDSYFEYRLLRAVRARTVVRPLTEEEDKRMLQAATSGFLDMEDMAWLETPGFCHIKLHGTSVLPDKKEPRLTWPPQQGDSTDLTTGYMFRFPTVARFACLSDSRFAAQDPPALLPWEIISNEGILLGQGEFEEIVGQEWQHRKLYPFYRALWRRARAEIQAADKISLVGLSIGPYMEPEFKYLFRRKEGIIELVVANPENLKYREYQNPFHSRTCCGRVLDLLSEVCPKIACNRSETDIDLTRHRGPSNSGGGAGVTRRQASGATARTDFADFIQNEL